MFMSILPTFLKATVGYDSFQAQAAGELSKVVISKCNMGGLEIFRLTKFSSQPKNLF